MKKSIIIIIIIIAIAAGTYIYIKSRKPKVNFEAIDWINKTVEYSMSVNGENRTGVQSLADSIITNINTKDGKYTFFIQSIFGFNQVQLAILQGNKVVTGILIDFKAQTQTPLIKLINN